MESKMYSHLLLPVSRDPVPMGPAHDQASRGNQRVIASGSIIK
jgi:hypothetical protein